MSDRLVLLNPGPVTLSPRVRSALTRADWCHREPEFATLTHDILHHLVHVYPLAADDYEAVMLTGSGTAAVESMLTTFAPSDSTTLVLENGVYGERMATMLARQHKPCVSIQRDWLAPLDLAEVERVLDARPDITHVAAVHHETTTGRLNDLARLGEICRRLERRLLLDAVSSFGAEAIDFADWNLAALAATANKCLHGAPGLSFVLAHEETWERCATPSSVYLDLQRYRELQHDTGYSPFTQAVHVAFALEAALEELESEGGWRTRHETYRARADRIGEVLAASEVDTLLDPDVSSVVLRSYRLPDGIDYAALHLALKRRGFVIYAGQGRLAPDVFRIAHMGDIREQDLTALLSALADVLG